MNTRFYDHQLFLNFLIQGKAMFVLTSERTGQAFTFRIKYPRGKTKGTMFIEYKGSDGRFLYLGNYDPDNTKVYLTRKTNPYMRHHPATTALMWVFEWIKTQSVIPSGVRIHHEGKCGMCGRAMTDPHSLKVGIGPECIKKERRNHAFQAELPGLAGTDPKGSRQFSEGRSAS